jgi:FlaA1/EpsC-like NDP-sugar epimerase
MSENSKQRGLRRLSSFLLSPLRRSEKVRRGAVIAWLTLGIIVCYYLAFFLRYDGNIPASDWPIMWKTLPIAVAVFMVVTLVFGIYKGLWSFFSFEDCVRHGLVFAFGGIVFLGVIWIALGFTHTTYPRSVFIIYPALLVGWELGGRGVLRWLNDMRRKSAESKQAGDLVGEADRLLLVGRPSESSELIRSVRRSGARLGEIVATISEDKNRGDTDLQGVPLFSDIERVAEIAERYEVTSVLFLPPFGSPATIRAVMGKLGESQRSFTYRVVPALADLASGRMEAGGIRRVEIEDVLNRKPRTFDPEILAKFLKGRRIMVTGGGGSIGSELCRQIAEAKPAVLALFDHSEYALFEIEKELRRKFPDLEVLAFAGNVGSSDDLSLAFHRVGDVDVLFHAAAYKHVDLMERNPVACFRNNTLGTATAAAVAEAEKVEHFILVSTDKAVRPTSLMGASKRLAERCVIERPESATQFKAVRFGNVLGSSGSVVPIFREQIAQGGPVTVTTPEVTRYFMTIPEAAQLVLVAAAVGGDRKILVLEMGEPVKIDTLARQMIELSGFVPEVDIKVEYTGLKPGEKEYEELLTDDENIVPTKQEGIWVLAADGSGLREPVDLDQLGRLVLSEDSEGLRNYAQEVIREGHLKRDGESATPAVGVSSGK